MGDKLNQSHKRINGQYHENKAVFQSLWLSKSFFVFWKEAGLQKDKRGFETFIKIFNFLSSPLSGLKMLRNYENIFG